MADERRTLVGYKFESGNYFNVGASKFELELLKGESGWAQACHIIARKLPHQVQTNEGNLIEVKIGGYELMEEPDESPSPPSPSPPPSEAYAPPSTPPSTSQVEDGQDREAKKWSNEKVKRLIGLYDEHSCLLTNNLIKKKDVWGRIASALNLTGGLQYTWAEVYKKWRGLKERYKKIIDLNSATGRGRTTWTFFDEIDQILGKDPAINPPILIGAGASASVSATPESTSTAPKTQTEKRKQKIKNDMPQWAKSFITNSKRESRRQLVQLKVIADQETRRNDLLEEMLKMMQKNN